MIAEKDEQVRYDECLASFISVDKNRPLDDSESYMKNPTINF